MKGQKSSRGRSRNCSPTSPTSNKKFLLKSYVPGSSLRDKWKSSVESDQISALNAILILFIAGAETLLKVKATERAEQIIEINKELCQELKHEKKKKAG